MQSCVKITYDCIFRLLLAEHESALTVLMQKRYNNDVKLSVFIIQGGYYHD